MSSTVLYVGEGDGFREAARIRNGNRSAPMLWDLLGKKYCPKVEFVHDRWKALWAYCDDHIDKMLDWERLAMRTTLLWVTVPAAEAAATISALRVAQEAIGDPCSMGEQADAMEAALADGATSFAWNQTTVQEFWGHQKCERCNAQLGETWETLWDFRVCGDCNDTLGEMICAEMKHPRN